MMAVHFWDKYERSWCQTHEEDQRRLNEILYVFRAILNNYNDGDSKRKNLENRQYCCCNPLALPKM